MDLKTSQLLDLTNRLRDQLDSFIKQLLNTQKRMYAVAGNAFDPEKFKARYSLQDSDFSTIPLNGQLYVSIINDSIKLADDPPIFEAPDVPQTPQQAATDLVAIILAKGTEEERTAATEALLRFVGQVKREG